VRYIIAVFIIAVLIVRTGFFVSSTYAAAGINQTINFQGKLVDNNGLNVANGNYDIVFYLYAASSGGSALWTETWNSGTTQVAVQDGVFRVALGTHSTFSSFNFNDDSLYLAIKVGADAEMSPRIRFTSVPYAFVAKTVVDDALDFAQFQDILDVDADLTVNQAAYTWTQDFTGTTTTGYTYNANSLTTGTALNISRAGAGLTTNGELINLNMGASTAGNGLNIVTTGVYTGTGLITLTANSATTGVVSSISNTGLTTGTGLSITGGTAMAAAGELLDLNMGAATTGSAATLRTTGIFTNTAGLLNITANGATTGSLAALSGTGLTTGTGLSITGGTAMAANGELLYLNMGAATAGNGASIITTGAYTGTGLLTLTANGATTGDIMNLSATGLTTGSALVITGRTTTGMTDHFVKITSDVGSASSLIYGAPDFSGSTVTGYGLNITATDSTATANTDYANYSLLTLTGNAAKTGYGTYGRVTTSSTTADTTYGGYFSTATTGAVTTGTQNTYGIYGTTTSANVAGGTVNAYGGYFKSGGTVASGTINSYGLYVANGTMNTTGTANNFGLYVEAPTGADTNVAGYFGGNVGIGTTSPGQKLDVFGNIKVEDADDRHIGFANGTGAFYRGMMSDQISSGFALRLRTSASGNSDPYIILGSSAGGITDALLVNVSTGYVGIGTTAPVSLFSVGAASPFQVDTNGDIVKLKNLTYSWPSAHAANGFLQNNGSGTLTWTTITGAGGVTGSGTDNYIPRWNGTTALENSSIFDDGTNVGIGTTVPTANLHVNTNSSTTALKIIQAGSGPILNLDRSTGFTVFRVESTGAVTIQTNTAVTDALSIVDTDFTNAINIAGNNILGTSSIWDGDGNVGIGTTSPGVKLDVVGYTKTNDLIVNNNHAWAAQANADPSVQGSLRFVTTHTGAGNEYTYQRITPLTYGYAIVSGDQLEFDIYCSTSNPSSVCDAGIEIDNSDFSNGRTLGITDQNGIAAHSGSKASYALGRWYHVKASLANLVGKTINYVSVVEESDTDGTYTNFYRKIFITNGSTTKNVIWDAGVPQANTIGYGSGNSANDASGSYFDEIYAAGTGNNYFAGNVGIGTTTPVGKLDVTDTSNTAASLSLTNNTATTIGNAGNTLGVLDLQSTSLTTGNFLNMEVNALTTGTALNISRSGAGLTTGGELVNLNMGAATAGNGLNIVTTGVYTGTGLITLTANSATTGVVSSISNTGLTSGTGLSITGGTAMAAAGELLDLNMGAATTGSAATLRTTGIFTNTAGLLNITANGATTGSLAALSGTGLTSGTGLSITGGAAMAANGELLYLNMGAAVAGNGASIATTGVYTGTGLLTLTANSATTGDIMNLSATGLTTGSALVMTGPSATGVTDHFLKITSDVGSASSLIYGAPDFSGSTVTGYGLNITATDSTATANTDIANYSLLTLTGNAAKSGYGTYGRVTTASTTADTTYGGYFSTATTGAVTTGTQNTYGIYGTTTSANVAGGTVNAYGGYFKSGGTVASGTINSYGLYVANGTMNTTGTANNFGLYVEAPSGADTNVAAYFGGNVGIGTTAPTSGYELDVMNDIRAAGEVFADGGGYAYFNAAGSYLGGTIIGAGGAVGYTGSSTTALWAGSGMPLVLGTNNSEYVRITSGGNVGIGTTAPVSLFSVGTGSPFQVDTNGDIIKLKNLTYAWPASHTTNGFLQNNGSGTLTWTTITGAGGVTGSGTDNYIPRWNGTTALENSNIFDDGTNVGIGTTAPSAPLEVRGDIKFGGVGSNKVGTLTSNTTQVTLRAPAGAHLGLGANGGNSDIFINSSGNVGIGTTTPGHKLEVAGSVLLNPNGGAGQYLYLYDTTNAIYGANGWLDLQSTSTLSMATGAYASIATTGNNVLYNINFKTQNTERMRIDNSGNVGIGTTSPGATLQVGKDGTAVVSDGFEDASLTPFTTSGDANWAVQGTTVYAGSYAAQAGTITGNQSTTMSLASTLAKPSRISFYFKVSSESNWDIMTFLIDGIPQKSWSGEVGWVKYSTFVNAGSRTFSWKYSKDSGTNVGSDTAWVDDVTITEYSELAKFVSPVEIGDVTSGSNAILSVGGNINTNGLYQINGNNILNTLGSGVCFGIDSCNGNNLEGFNTFLGAHAGKNNTLGWANTLVGNNAGLTNTTGVRNTFIGENAGYSNTIGGANIAIGQSALYANTEGNYNVAMGANALDANIAGLENTAIGWHAVGQNTSGGRNTGVGAGALYLNTTGSYNVAVGRNAGRYYGSGTDALTDPENSIYIGYNSRAFSNDDSNSIVIGYEAIGIGANTVVLGNDSITTTALKGNVGIGTTSPTAKLTVQGTNSIASLGSELLTTTADRDFSAAGNWTGTGWTVGSGVATHTAGANEFVHTFTPTANSIYQIKATINTTTAGTIGAKIGSTAGSLVGHTVVALTQHTWVIEATDTGSLRFSPDATWEGTIDDVTVMEITPTSEVLHLSNSDGSAGLRFRSGGTDLHNFFVGEESGVSNISGLWNIGIGRATLKSNLSASGNVAFGDYALTDNTTGAHNVAIGDSVLNNNTIGKDNVAIGRGTMAANTTGENNTAIGGVAMATTKSGTNNTAIGYASMWSNSTGGYNAGLGRGTLYSNTTGSYNTALGYRASNKNTTGSYITALGTDAGMYFADGVTSLTDAENSIYIGALARGYNNDDSNSIVIGYEAIGIGANTVVLGNDSITTTALKGNVGIGTTSPGYKLDARGSAQFIPTGTSGLLIDPDGIDSTRTRIFSGGGITLQSNKSNGILTQVTNATGDSGSAKTILQIDSSGTPITTAGSYLFAVKNTGSNLFVIDKDGNVGIGTTTPTTDLQVGEGSSSHTQIDPGTLDIGYSTDSRIFLTSNIHALLGTGNGAGGIRFQTLTGGNAYIGGAGTGSDLMLNPTAGNVGIGTTSPGAKLDVKVSSKAEAIRLTSGGYIYFGSTNDGAPSASDMTGAKLVFYQSAANSQSSYALGAEAGNMWFNTLGGYKWYTTGTNVPMVLTSVGNIGIGTTAPVGKLDVTHNSNTAASLSLTNNTATTIGNAGNTLGVLDLQSTSLTTGNFLNMEVNGLTTGTALNISRSGAGLTTGGELVNLDMGAAVAGNGVNIATTGVYTGTGLITLTANAATTGSLAAFSGGGLTTGTGLSITGGTALQAAGELLDLNMGAATTGSAATLRTTGVFTNTAGLLNITANAATTGSLAALSGTGLTTGTGLSITTNTALQAAGELLDLNMGAATTGSAATLRTTGVFTNTAGLLNITANAATTGSLAALSGTGLTTGTGLSITGGASMAAGGELIDLNMGAATAGNGLNIATTGVYTGTGLLTLTGNSATTGTLAAIAGNGLTTGTGLSIASTSTALTTGRLMSLDWSPSGSTEIYATGDLFRINTGTYGNVGNLLNILDDGSSLFSVSQSQITNNLPTAFNAAGDVSMAYDLIFTNQTTANIFSNGPLSIVAGESWENNNLTLQTYGTGDIVANLSTGRFLIPTGNVGIGTTAPGYTLDVKSTGTNIAQFTGVNSTGCTLSSAGIIACSSDRDLKKNIVESELGLDAIMQLRPVTYNWNFQEEGDQTYLGFIAQEVAEVSPDLVTIDNNGYRQLNSIGIIPIVAKAIQEQQGIITTLQAEVYNSIPDAKIATVSSKLETLNSKVSGWDGLFISIQSIIQSIQETFVAIQSQLGFVRSDIQSTKEQVASLSASLTDIANWKEAVSSGGAALGQSTGSAVLGATDSAMLGEVATASSLMVKNNLQVDGKTTLFDLTVLNKLTSGVIQIGAGIDGDEINASTGIRFQTLAQGPVDFMNGKVIIDVDGSISAKHFKLDTLDATSSTGGKAIMPAGEILTTVQTTSINADSMVYVTIQGDYAPATRYWVTNQVEGDSFMVQFDRPTTLPVEFSWFIIN